MTTPTTTVDLLTLAGLREHPRVVDAQSRVNDAQRKHVAARERLTRAREELRAEHERAAMSERDDRRLRAKADAVTSCVTDIEISELVLAKAKQAADETYRDVCVEVDREFRERHATEIRALERALQDARRASFNATLLEEASGRLFVGGIERERKEPGRPLPRISWTWAFGGPRAPTLADTRFETWRTHCGVTFDK